MSDERNRIRANDARIIKATKEVEATLLDCPFCGEGACLTGGNKSSYQVECMSCPAITPGEFMGEGYEMPEHEAAMQSAAAAWNTRYTPEED